MQNMHQPGGRLTYQNSSRTSRTELSPGTEYSFRIQLSPPLPTASRVSSERDVGPARQTAFALAQIIKNGTKGDANIRSKLATPAQPPRPSLALRASSPFLNDPFLVYSGLAPCQKIPSPLWLGNAQQGLYIPTAKELSDALPISELCCMVIPCNAAVIKIVGIPNNTTRQDIVTFLGRKAKIISQPERSSYLAIHIMMEYNSGKSTHCYVEVVHEAEAVVIATAFRSPGPRNLEMGGQIVRVLRSSQDELLTDMFPGAKQTRWEASKPVVDMTPRTYWTGEEVAGFQGLIKPEELSYVIRHALRKYRSRAAKTRPYETLISIMHKYPWYSSKLVFIHERDRIYSCAFKLSKVLLKHIGTHDTSSRGVCSPQDSSLALLQELTIAALVCPGFTELQKADVVHLLREHGYFRMVDRSIVSVDIGGVHELAGHWPFLTLSVKPGADIELVKYYGQIFHDATIRDPRAHVSLIKYPMGEIMIKYNEQDDPSILFLSQAAEIELAEVTNLINKGLAQQPARRNSPPLNSHQAIPRSFHHGRLITSGSVTPRQNHNVGGAIAQGEIIPYATNRTQTVDQAPNTRQQSRQTMANPPNHRTYNPNQHSAGGWGFRSDNTAQAVAGVQKICGDGPTQNTAGADDGWGGYYTLAQAMATAELRQRQVATDVYGMRQNPPLDYGSRDGAGHRATMGSPAYIGQNNPNTATSGSYNNDFPGANVGQDNVHETVQGYPTNVPTGPRADRVNTRQQFHGHHHSARTRPHANQSNVREPLAVYQGTASTEPRAEQNTLRPAPPTRQSAFLPGPLNNRLGSTFRSNFAW